jgi:ABC-2 type transport system ATP-binding protein
MNRAALRMRDELHTREPQETGAAAHHPPSCCVIEVENLVKTYREARAVDGISFCVKKGEIFGLLGPNGAGKTTTLSVLEGLTQADEGRVRVLQMDMDVAPAQIRGRIGVLLQSTSLLPDLTVVEQVEMFAGLYGRHMKRNEALALLERVGIAEKANAFPARLSGGQMKRLAITLATINNPEIVFLDEPSTGLDPQARRDLWEIMLQLREQGKTLVVTTHYLHEAEALCDRVGIMERGRLVALDTPGALMTVLGGLSSITISARLSINGIQDLPHVVRMLEKDSGVCIQTNDVMATLGGLLELARRDGISLKDLHISQPSLEDVYLKLTGWKHGNARSYELKEAAGEGIPVASV